MTYISVRKPGELRGRPRGQRPTGGAVGIMLKRKRGRPKGYPKTGGRGPGTPPKKVALRREMEAEALKLTADKDGIFQGDGLQFLQAVYKNPALDINHRTRCAAQAARYEQPRLQAIQHVGPGGGPIQIANISDLELARRIAFLLTKPEARQIEFKPEITLPAIEIKETEETPA